MTKEPLDFDRMLSDLSKVLRSVDEREAFALQQAILESPAVHLTGSGRSALVARSFAMRLAHLGRTVHVMGDPATPAFAREDLLIICTASGDSGSN